ncbi:hypothetical protein ABKA04_009418 [Annulohypoxylon sp. FPYF3050]
MAPKSPANKVDMSQARLSPRDMEILALAWQCFETQPKVNYEKLAKIAEFKNANTASTCFGSVKKKIMSASKSSEPSTPTKSSGKQAAEAQTAPNSGKKRKLPTKSPRKGHPKTEEDGDDDEKVFKKKKKNQLKAEDVDDEDAQLMSGLLGFDVKKKLQEREKRTKREDDENEA